MGERRGKRGKGKEQGRKNLKKGKTIKDREKVRKGEREEKDTVRRGNSSGNLPLVSLIPAANFPPVVIFHLCR